MGAVDDAAVSVGEDGDQQVDHDHLADAYAYVYAYAYACVYVPELDE